MDQPELFTMSYRNNSRRCEHLYQPTELDNVNIFCSAWKLASKYDRPTPDFALYADPIWVTKSRNEFINWPDFGVPRFQNLAYEQILGAYSIAKKFNVEIGCIGGHGRTGTILACMTVIDKNIDATQAIDFVRSTYCHHAIETSSQESFVEFFHDRLAQEEDR